MIANGLNPVHMQNLRPGPLLAGPGQRRYEGVFVGHIRTRMTFALFDFAFVRGLAAGFALAAPIGPVAMLCIRRALVLGRLQGFIAGLGAAFADMMFGAIAGLGLTVVSTFILAHEIAFGLIGGIIVLIVGLVTYRAPVEDILFAMRHSAGLEDGLASGLYADLADGVVEAVLEEAGKFAEDRIAPLNRVGDKEMARLVDGKVVMPKGFAEAYRDWAAGGWAGVAAEEAHGGQGLPILLNIGCTEIWNSANLAFALNPLLTMGAVEALTAHGSPELQRTFLTRMIAGEWTGTMNLTEPQAGSDLALLTSRAEPQGDGTYRIFGQKIFIT